MELDRATLLFAGGFALLAASVLLQKGTAPVAAVVAVGMVLAAWHATVLRWPAVIGLLVSVMLFVPIGRYSIPINLPFGLELYRLVVAARPCGLGRISARRLDVFSCVEALSRLRC